MTVAVYINDEKDVANMLPWGARFAIAQNTDLLLVIPKRSKTREGWVELNAKQEDSDTPIRRSVLEGLEQLDSERFSVGTESQQEDASNSKYRVTAKELFALDPNRELVQQVEELGISLLLIDAGDPIFRAGDTGEESLDLFFDSPCQTMVIRGEAADEGKPLRVLVASDGVGDESDVAIERAFDLVQDSPGRVTFLYVRPDDYEEAEEVGLVSANRKINRLYSLRRNIDCRVALADKLRLGIESVKDLSQFDLVIVNTQSASSGYKFVRAWEQSDATSKVPLAIIKGRVPLTTRVWDKLKKRVRSVVPQMDRESRVKLVDRLDSNSQWDFDFIALISLSTLIAALGLVRDSGAVVIGAMLVAPLMTPIVGIGFALIQCNIKLILQSLKSLGFGFALAFVIGMVVGVTVHAFGFDELQSAATISKEMDSRGHPNFLDLVVALVSGIAGAYALGRPNLISALPGVAIAAALVPPIATSGIAFSMFGIELLRGASSSTALLLCGGSLLLFLTNIVAIVLGCAFVFWAVGIDSPNARKQKPGENRKIQQWPRWVFAIFVVLSIAAATVMHFMELNEAKRQDRDRAPSLNSSVVDELKRS